MRLFKKRKIKTYYKKGYPLKKVNYDYAVKRIKEIEVWLYGLYDAEMKIRPDTITLSPGFTSLCMEADYLKRKISSK